VAEQFHQGVDADIGVGELGGEGMAQPADQHRLGVAKSVVVNQLLYGGGCCDCRGMDSAQGHRRAVGGGTLQ
jgi:hypothetical protein